MIRDPSDGSVRAKPVVETSTTGLAPAMTQHQADEAARLQRSRDWLSKYRTDPEKVVRQTGETGEGE